MVEPPYPATPRWVKVFAIAGLIVLVVVAVVFVGTALGLHTPGMHGPAQTH